MDWICLGGLEMFWSVCEGNDLQCGNKVMYRLNFTLRHSRAGYTGNQRSSIQSIYAMNPDPKDPRAPRISMRDIGKAVGVSHVTVSLALRDHPRISAAIRARVREVAAELGYRPDPMLTALSHYRKSKANHPIAAAIAWVNAWENPSSLRQFKEFECYWQGASTAAEKYGYRLEEFRVGATINPRRLHQILSTRGISGLLLPPQTPQPDWSDFPWSEYSVVRFGRSLQSPRCHVVTADQVANTLLAFEETRARGYRRIGFITDESNMRITGHLFESGYLTSQRFVDDSERLPIFVMNHHPVPERKRALASWLETHQADAIITNMAEVAPMLKSMGIRVPEDVALAGTTVLDSNIDSGIDQHPMEIGRVAFLMLNSLINDGSRGIPPIFRQVLVEGSWVDGTCLPDRRNTSR
ncbi:MAG: LacI family DNA-binding transcriptional regulator [Luteolibacter sp.]